MEESILWRIAMVRCATRAPRPDNPQRSSTPSARAAALRALPNGGESFDDVVGESRACVRQPHPAGRHLWPRRRPCRAART